LQPNAVTFGPPYAGMPIGVRWVGNERGYADATQWCTYPMGVPEDPKTLNIGVEGADRWFPAETDVSIRPGWYWHPDTDDDVKSVEKLLDIYYHSVGHNTNLLLNFPVNDRGLVHENDAAALRAMTRIIRATFENDLARGCRATATNVRGNDPRYGARSVTDGDGQSYWATDDGVTTGSLEIEFGGERTFDRVLLREQIALGQRVQSWSLEVRIDGEWSQLFEGTTIGNKRIAVFETVTGDAVRLNILESLACPTIEAVGVFLAPAKPVCPI
jgi:alpha-L-fucosidase